MTVSAQRYRHPPQHLRQWLILPLVWLLLLNALALPGKMPPASQPASAHASMAMMAMQHDMSSTCHTPASDDCGKPALPHCDHPSTCSLCHASPALAVSHQHAPTFATIIDQGWQTPSYTSIVTANPYRPPARLLA